MDLQSKVAIVTGAGSGIGRAIAIELSRRGCNCVLVGRTESKLREALAEVQRFAVSSRAELCDVTSEEQIARVVEIAQRQYGRLDVLVNNAGVMVLKLFGRLSAEEFGSHMLVNYYGAVQFVRAVAPILVRQGRGAIINVASVGGELHLPGMTANCASKAALYAFSEALHYELKPRGVHVGVVLAGGARTGLFDHAVFDGLGEYYRDQCFRRDRFGTVAAKVARKVRQMIERERFEVIVPFRDRIPVGLRWLAPSLFRRYMMRRLRPYLEAAESGNGRRTA